MSWTLPCICCGVALTTAFTGDAEGGQPGRGTVFISHGNYGSTVYDPGCTREFLRVHICDKCLLAAAGLGVVRHVLTIPSPDRYDTDVWKPELEWCARCDRAREDHVKHDDEPGAFDDDA